MHFRAGTDCPPVLKKTAVGLFDTLRNGMLPEDEFGALEQFMALAANAGHELRAYDDALDFIAGKRDAARRATKLGAAVPARCRRSRATGAPEGAALSIPGRGRPVCVRAGRTLIGDEMGLGKTSRPSPPRKSWPDTSGSRRALVVCPTSLKYQWQREIAKIHRTIGGARDQRHPGAAQQIIAADDFYKITNYENSTPTSISSPMGPRPGDRR